MNFQPNQITKEHVLRAIQKIEKEHLTLIAPTRWYVEINGQKYPPKEVMRYAHEQMNGEKIWNYGGGEPTNKYLKQMGFTIIDKTENPVLEMISNYKKHLREHKLTDELYKWQLIQNYKGKPQLDASSFVQDILSIDFNNLVYNIAIGAIRHLSKERTEAYRQCLIGLFDEKEALQKRIEVFSDNVLKLYRELILDEKLSHHHDERTISVLLTYHNPEKYTFYKDSYYQKYCKLLNVKAEKKGAKYVHYLELIDELIEEYLSGDKELVTLFRSCLPTHVYQDEGLNILAQDILFTQLDNSKMMDENEIEESQQKENNMKQPLNQILYGPPGTGKTYHTINKAVAIANPDFKDFDDRKKLKDEYDRLVKEGQIVFTTFHQSMSYEDFIEGIKPKLEGEGNEVQYQIENGILKKTAQKAITEYYNRSQNPQEENSILRLRWFNDAWAMLVQEAQAALDNNSHKELLSLTNKSLDIVNVTDLGNLILKPRVDEAIEYTVSYQRAQKLFEAFQDLSEIKNIDKEFRQVIGGSNSTAYWCVLNHLNLWVSKQLNNTKVDLPEANINILKFDGDIIKNNLSKEVNNYVLIIDEINRGNVSQIFGELITLIEEDKRLGNDEALQVTLPYSKDSFGVPPNLYIIGTMNTADRSVEALDTALRRRFSFEEMLSRPDLLHSSKMFTRLLWKYEDVEWDEEPYRSIETSFSELYGPDKEFHSGKNAIWEQMVADQANGVENEYFKEFKYSGLEQDVLLNTINLRIEKLLTKDHQIGHAYLMNVYSEEELKYAFYNKIIPLLQEYFYGDYGKIGLVLGKGFVKIKSNENDQKIFADFDPNYASDYSGKEIFEINDFRKGNCTVDEKPMTFQEAVKAIYTK